LERIGIVITALWLTLIGFIVYQKWDSAVSMPLNEWGDFLAGATAPLAFLWLIIGYMLQRKELTANTAALTFQKEEMKRQADELKEHSKYLEESAKAARTQATVALSRR